MSTRTASNFVSTCNACKLCSPLGASVVFRGIEGCIPLLHGSQGCATYIRRYIISHFREPIDVASSNFSESSAIFGGGQNLQTAIANVTRQYRPSAIGVATTCLSETIGDDVPMYLHQLRSGRTGNEPLPLLIHASTPSYSGTHMDGFHAAVRAVVESLAEGGERGEHLNVLPGFVSPADLRYLKEVCADFGVPSTLLPDYSDTLDGPTWADYECIPPGGTPLASIRAMGRARATLELGLVTADRVSAGQLLQERFHVPAVRLGLPIGVRATDALFEAIQEHTGRSCPQRHTLERGRLIDSYVDGHKYVFGKRAVVYGEEDLVIGLAAFLAEVGITPVLCASGGESGRMAECLQRVLPEKAGEIEVRQGADFHEIAELAGSLGPDLLVGSSKGYSTARKLNIPLIRAGFPVHDRFGGQRIGHIGYRGAQQLFDRIVNAILERKQEESPVGYSYL